MNEQMCVWAQAGRQRNATQRNAAQCRRPSVCLFVCQSVSGLVWSGLVWTVRVRSSLLFRFLLAKVCEVSGLTLLSVYTYVC